MSEDRTDSPKAEKSRYTDPELAVDHVRRVARETADESGYRAAAFAVMQLRREYSTRTKRGRPRSVAQRLLARNATHCSRPRRTSA